MTHPTAPSGATSAAAVSESHTRLVALAGNPNVGKTTVFNGLTGLRQKVGNYPGVTVERKLGKLRGPNDTAVEIVDVPGTYSLNPRSLDEEIAYRVLVGGIPGQARPDLIVCVVDASNLERNLYLTSQVLDLGVPAVMALNMTDAAESEGLFVRAGALAEELGIPVIPLSAARGEGIDALKEAILGPLPPVAPRQWTLPDPMAEEVNGLAQRLAQDVPELPPQMRFADALRALANSTAPRFESHHSLDFWNSVDAARARLRDRGSLYEQEEIVARYHWITPIAARVLDNRRRHGQRSMTDRLDAILTHRVSGPLVFLAVLALIFQAVFAWAVPAMDLIDMGVAALGDFVGSTMPAGPLRDLLVDGAIAGVGGILIFLPQILLLFFFLGLLEDTGYMARAAFLMDRVMKKVGLSGRSVVPLISAYACAVPGIMATRTMDNQRDRLVTIMVTPLMTCSARLPVYALMIAAFIPAGGFLFVGNQAFTLLGLYLMGTGMAVLAAWVLKRYVIRGERSIFVMELPPYRRPKLRDVLWRMLERAKLFVSRAGTIILAISIVLWFLAAYPALPEDSGIFEAREQLGEAFQLQLGELHEQFAGQDAALESAQNDLAARYETQLTALDQREAASALRNSFIGRAGLAIEPLIRPLGFDWKIGVAVITSFAAREVVVSALSTIYSVGDESEGSFDLANALRADTYPDTGEPVWSPLVAVSMLVFFVLACQCMSTLAIVKRETNSWRWPVVMWFYMTGLAYLASLLVYQGGQWLGLS